MSEKRPSLESRLPIADNETGILIKWNRDNAVYEVSFEGRPLHYDSFRALMESVTGCMQAFTNDEGIIVPSLELDEQKKTEDQMLINKQNQSSENTEETESQNIPPWLKN